MSIGTNVKAARTAANVSIKGLAKVSGVTRETISRLERGIQAPHLATLEKLAKALGLSLPELLGSTQEKP